MTPNRADRILRFTPVQRLFHVTLILLFLTQGATGLGRMYVETAWGRGLVSVFGGYEASLTVHKYVGFLMICGFSLHVLYLLFRINWREFPAGLFRPDSIVPQVKDIRNFFQHIAWFLCLGRAPQFDRWGYWEKFDYWAVFWGIPVLAGTGLILAYPVVSSTFLPGWFLNVALWIHRIEAMLAMVHVFIIHFFIAHLRRHNFPMDRTMFEGSSSLEATRDEKPAWIARLEQNGELETRLVSEASPRIRLFYYLFGYVALGAGVFLLLGGILNSPNVTW
jgi:cytochrome b subunit of formate dehydrogenase